MKFLPICIIIFLLFCPESFCDREEFFIVTDGPVAVGGGMIRHYLYADDDVISTRYSFGGVSGDSILVKELTTYKNTGSERTETIKVLLDNPSSKKTAIFQVGSHTVKLRLNKHGRVIVREAK